jgi:hypothetical protein
VPFLRVLRDRYGYETTCLMHLFRDGPRARSKILYAFRSPQTVGVGVKLLSADVKAQLARLYRDVPFDWRELVAHKQVVKMGEPFRPLKRSKSANEGVIAPPRMSAPPAGDEAKSAEEGPIRPPARPTPLPVAIGGETPEEQVEWLIGWYPRVRELLAQRFHDEVRLQELSALADRLDPSGWSDDAARTEGLEAAAEAWGRLTPVFARRRRGRRRSSGSRKPEAVQSPTEAES